MLNTQKNLPFSQAELSQPGVQHLARISNTSLWRKSIRTDKRSPHIWSYLLNYNHVGYMAPLGAGSPS